MDEHVEDFFSEIVEELFEDVPINKQLIKQELEEMEIELNLAIDENVKNLGLLRRSIAKNKIKLVIVELYRIAG